MGAFVLNQRDGMAKQYTRNGEYWVEGTELNDTIVNGGYYDSYDYYSLQADHYHRGDKATISGYEGSDKILNYGVYWSREIVTTSAKNNVSEKVSCNR